MLKDDFSKMYECGVHIGHRTQKWNPKMKKYIHGEKNGIHVIDLEKTEDCLKKAMEFLNKLSVEGKTVLFVSTKPQSIKLLEGTAIDVHMPYVVNRWISGLLTNFDTLKTRIKYFVNLKEQDSSGELEKYTKKEASNLRKQIEKLETTLGGVQTLTRLPDAVFVVDAVRDSVVVKEALKLKIPLVSIVDTNADPTKITYPIPANDDAVKSLTYVLGKIKEAFKKTSK